MTRSLAILAMAICAASIASAQGSGPDTLVQRDLFDTGRGHAIVPRAVADRLGAVYTKPDPTIPAVIGHYLVCVPFTVGYDGQGNPVQTVTCDPVIVYCPDDDNAPCITID